MRFQRRYFKKRVKEPISFAISNFHERITFSSGANIHFHFLLYPASVYVKNVLVKSDQTSQQLYLTGPINVRSILIRNSSSTRLATLCACRWPWNEKRVPFNVSHQHPNSNYYTLNFLMNRIERQARWNGALVHWFHGPPVALLSYPPHWFRRIGHAGCKTLFYAKGHGGSMKTRVLLLRLYFPTKVFPTIKSVSILRCAIDWEKYWKKYPRNKCFLTWMYGDHKKHLYNTSCARNVIFKEMSVY